MTRPLIIESLNCNGLGDYRKRRRIFNHFFKRKVDIILLQETHTTPTLEKAYTDQWKALSKKHNALWSSLSSRSCGVGILIADQSKIKLLQSMKDQAGRVITIQVKYAKNTYQFQSIYAPTKPEPRPLFFQELGNYLFTDGQIIAGGDFNMVENPEIDRRGGAIYSSHRRGKEDLDEFKTRYSLADIWRERNPQARAYSWSTKDGTDIHSRLDRFYLSNSLHKAYLSQYLFINPWSDHRTLSLTIEIKNPVKRGSGYFKLNTALLEEDEYVDLIREFLMDWIENLPSWSSIQQWWVEAKNRIKAITLDYSYQQARLRKQKMAALTKFLHEENEKLQPNKQYIADTQEKIAALREYIYRGTMVRSRDNTIIDGEKPTRYFYAKERIQKAYSTITELVVPTLKNDPKNRNDINDEHYDFDFTLLNKDEDILLMLKEYYQDLFTKQDLDTSLQDKLINNIDTKLPGTINAMMDSDVTIEELTMATKLMEVNKTPGIDGLPIEFYISFWDLLSEFFPKLMNDIYVNGLLPSIQQRLSVITLVHKKGDKESLDNWRPISLLCVDYKILEKVLSLRLKKALPHIIGEEQTCGIEGRTIFQNLYTIRDTINYANDHQIPTYIISLDFQKAFDKVDHSFLIKALTAFGFGSRYTNYIKSSNSNSFAVVSNNGYLTSKINLERGIKQGGQESQQLYDIIGEVLATEIRKNCGIRGIHLPGKPNQLKLTLYADDNNPILTSKQSIVNLFAILERFRRASGCNINVAKTQGLTVGGAAIPDLPFPIQWNPEKGVKILGIYFFNKFSKTQKVTWEHVVNNIQKRAEHLSTRQNSFYGKRILINSLLLSKAWHVATVVPSTKATSQKINSIIFAYLFANKNPQSPAQDILKLNFHHGGIAILDFDLQQKSLRLNRLRHILDPKNHSTWLTLPRLYLGSQILKYHNDWFFLSSPTIPKINYDDPIIRHFNINIPFYLQELTNFLRTHKHRFLLIKNPSTHLIYQLFLKDKWASTIIRSQTYWNSVMNCNLPWKRIWTVTYKSLHKGKYLDTYYWFLSNALPSGHKMSHSRRPYENNCRRCHRYETTHHIFAECPFARGVWNHYHYIYAKILQIPQVSYVEALFSTTLPRDNHQRLLLLTVTTIIVHELWRARCAQYKQGTPTNIARSTTTINAKIKIIHFAYFRSCAQYAKRLCLPSPICKVEDGKLIFNLPEVEEQEQPPDSEFTSDYISDSSSDNLGG